MRHIWVGKRTSTNPAEVREHFKLLRTKDVRLFGSVLAIRITLKFMHFVHELLQCFNHHDFLVQRYRFLFFRRRIVIKS